jgi:hypothetical protein
MDEYCAPLLRTGRFGAALCGGDLAIEDLSRLTALTGSAFDTCRQRRCKVQKQRVACGDKESTAAGIALPACTSSQLMVDPPDFMPLEPDDM